MQKKSGGYAGSDEGNSFLNKGIHTGSNIGLKGANATQKGIRNLNNKLRKNSGKALKKGAKAIGKAVKKTAKGIVDGIKKIPWWVWLIIFVVLILFSVYSYFATNSNTGKSDNKVDYQNTLDADGNVIAYSDANSAINSFYLALSRNKSTWQEYDDNGETILIRPTDERAVSDYFGYDKVFVLNPELLYAINEYLYDEEIYFYPEGILNPVAYEAVEENGEKKYNLLDLEGEDNKCLVMSDSIDLNTGDKTGEKENNVSSYGLSTVFSYEEKEKYSKMEYTYIQEYTIDENGMLNWVDIPEDQQQRQYSGNIDYSLEHILTNAVTMAGTMHYTYEDTHICTENASGTSSDENSNALIIDFGNKQAEMYVAVATDGSGNMVYGANLDYLTANYCSNGKYRLLTRQTTTTQSERVYESKPAGMPDDVWEQVRNSERETEVLTEEPVKRTITYNYRKMRSSDSGIYEYWCRNKDRETDDKGSEYLYSYLNLFCTYTPNISRNYSFFREFTSQAGTETSSFVTLNSTQGVVSDTGGYNGNNVVLSGEQMETAKKVWSALLTLGFTKEQAGGVMGNIYQECRFNHLAVNQSDGGSGLCQWTTYNSAGTFVSDRQNKLNAFADSKGKTWEDLDTQLQYMCMELDGNNRYSQTDYIWGQVHGKGCTHFSAKDTWSEFCKDGEDVRHYAHVMAVGFEGAPESYTARREDFAEELYNLFYDTGIEYDIALIEPDNAVGTSLADTSGTAGISTAGFNDTDKQRFYDFYHAVDDDKDLTYSFYSHPLSTEEIDDLIVFTNSLILDTTKSQAKLEYEASGDINMWDNGYLSEIAKKREFSFIGDGTSDWVKIKINQMQSGYPAGCTVTTLQMIIQNSMSIDTEQYPQYQLEPSDDPYAPANPSAYSTFDVSTHNMFGVGAVYDSWNLNGFINYSDLYCNGSFSRVDVDTLNNATGRNYMAVDYQYGDTIVGCDGIAFKDMTKDEQLEALKPIWSNGYYVAFAVYYVGEATTSNGPAGYRGQHLTMLSCVNDNNIEICDPAGGKFLCYYSADGSCTYPQPTRHEYNLVYLILFKNSLTSPVQDSSGISVDNTVDSNNNTEVSTEAPTGN